MESENIEVKDVTEKPVAEEEKNGDEKKTPVVIFCVPGNQFSNRFLTSWTATMVALVQKNYRFLLVNQYSSVVHYARAKCLGGDISGGEDQKPYQGEIDYDYIFWIDSDIVFTPEQVFAMIESPHDVTSALYMMDDAQHFAVVKKWDLEYFKKNKHFEFLKMEDIEKMQKEQRYNAVNYAGMGFMCIKKGVIEKLKYPWFWRGLERIEVDGEEGKTMVDMASEDVNFCKNIQDAGLEIMLDTYVRVGHEKKMIL